MKARLAQMFAVFLVVFSIPLIRRQYLQWEFEKARESSLRNTYSVGWKTDSPDPMTRAFAIRHETVVDRIASVQFPIADDPRLIYALSYSDSLGCYLVVDWLGTNEVEGVKLVFKESSHYVAFGEGDLIPRESAKGLYVWRSIEIPRELPFAMLDHIQLVGPNNQSIGAALKDVVVVPSNSGTEEDKGKRKGDGGLF